MFNIFGTVKEISHILIIANVPVKCPIRLAAMMLSNEQSHWGCASL